MQMRLFLCRCLPLSSNHSALIRSPHQPRQMNTGPGEGSISKVVYARLVHSSFAQADHGVHDPGTYVHRRPIISSATASASGTGIGQHRIGTVRHRLQRLYTAIIKPTLLVISAKFGNRVPLERWPTLVLSQSRRCNWHSTYALKLRTSDSSLQYFNERSSAKVRVAA
jgi:hypothetical protein